MLKFPWCKSQELRWYDEPVLQTLENRREEARAYSNLGSAFHSQRDFDKAVSYHTRVLELAQDLADRAVEMRAYAGLGHAARCMQVGITSEQFCLLIILLPKIMWSINPVFLRTWTGQASTTSTNWRLLRSSRTEQHRDEPPPTWVSFSQGHTGVNWMIVMRICVCVCVWNPGND